MGVGILANLDGSPSMSDSVAKVCAYCGANCSDKPRTKDEAGRYYCKECFPKAKAAVKTGGVASAGAARPAGAAKAPVVGVFDDPILLDPELVGGKDEPKQVKVEQPQAVQPKSCPSCGVLLPGDAVVCTNCGFNTATGKGLKTKIERAKAAKASSGGRLGGYQGDYASAWHRFVAAFVDNILAGILTVVVLMVVGMVAASIGPLDPGSWQAKMDAGEIPPDMLLFVGAYFAVPWLYFVLQESSGRQATVGKSLMGFGNATGDGQPVGLGRATVRYVVKAVGLGFFSIFYAVACLICCMVLPKKQMPHDLIAGVVMMR